MVSSLHRTRPQALCREEFCAIDEKTGKPIVLSVEEKERIFVDALQAYYYDGREILSDKVNTPTYTTERTRPLLRAVRQGRGHSLSCKSTHPCGNAWSHRITSPQVPHARILSPTQPAYTRTPTTPLQPHTTQDFDQLKEDLLWEGSQVAALNRDETKFLAAMSAYLTGAPIMSDAEFDKLKASLKVPCQHRGVARCVWYLRETCAVGSLNRNMVRFWGVIRWV